MNPADSRRLIAGRGGSWWCSAGTCSFFNLVDIGSMDRRGALANQGFRVVFDAEKAAARRSRAHQRGLEMPEAVVEFIMLRERRDMSTLVALLDELDAVALAQGRALTVPFVREVLARRNS